MKEAESLDNPMPVENLNDDEGAPFQSDPAAAAGANGVEGQGHGADEPAGKRQKPNERNLSQQT